MSFSLQKLSSFMKSHSSGINLREWAIGVLFRKFPPVPMSSKLFPNFLLLDSLLRSVETITTVYVITHYGNIWNGTECSFALLWCGHKPKWAIVWNVVVWLRMALLKRLKSFECLVIRECQYLGGIYRCILVGESVHWRGGFKISKAQIRPPASFFFWFLQI